MEARNPAEWQQRIRDAKPEEKAAVCEEALRIWPAATEVWLAYLKAVAATATTTAERDPVGALLARCLPLSVDPRLYEAYVEHIKSTKPEDVGAAYEFATEAVSAHPESGALWKAYIDWLASQPVANDWEETFRRDRVRKAYKRAVTLPLANIEALWRAYGQFETRISRVSARKFIDERSPAYMKARSAFRTYQTMTRGLAITTMPSPELSRAEAPRWRQYIEWERSNPLELEDTAELDRRVRFAYTRVTQYARWSPLIWFDAGAHNDAKFWEEGASAMPESCLLAFKLSEHYELMGDYDKAREPLLKFTSCASADTATAGWVELVKCTHRMRGIDAAREVVKQCLAELGEPRSELYIAAAAVEHSAGNNALEDRIWEFAYAKFGDTDPVFTAKYIEFLFGRGDLLNARSVFEQAAAQLGGAGTATPNLRKLWTQMLHLEAKHTRESGSDLTALKTLESRYLKLFPATDEIGLFMQRFGDDASRLFDVTTAETPLNAADLSTSEDGTPAPPSTATTATTATAGTDLSAVGAAAVGLAKRQAVPRIPDGQVMRLLKSLPAVNLYDGPIINNEMLMQYVYNINI